MSKLKLKIKQILKKINMEILFLLIIIVAISLSYKIYKSQIEKTVNHNTTLLLQEIIDESIDDISIKINDTFIKMEAMSSFIGQYDDIQCEEVIDALQKHDEQDLKMFSGIIKQDGLGLTAEKTEFQADFEDWYFEEALSGERSISGVLSSDKYDGEYIILAVPVVHDDEICGVLQCAYDIQMFTGLIGETSIGKKGTTFIAQNDGKLVSRPESVGSYDNLFELLDSFSNNQTTIGKLKKQIKNRESGILTLNTGKYKRYVCYSTIPETDWYAVSIVSSGALEDVTDRITNYALMLSVGITVVFSLYILYWFVVHYINVTRMHMKEQRYHIVANQSDSIVFEYNVRDKTAYHTHKWKEKFGYPPVKEDYIENMIKDDIVYSEDAQIFRNIYDKLEKENSDYEEAFVRINDAQKNPIQCKIRASAIRNKRNHLVRVVGKIIEIKYKEENNLKNGKI